MARIAFLAAAVALLPSAFAQFLPKPEHFTHATGYADVKVRYKKVPTGICELDPKVKSYSGYADVAPHQHLFFWFFEGKTPFKNIHGMYADPPFSTRC